MALLSGISKYVHLPSHVYGKGDVPIYRPQTGNVVNVLPTPGSVLNGTSHGAGPFQRLVNLFRPG